MNFMLRKARWSVAKQRADDLTDGYSNPPIPALEIAESRGVNVVFATFNQFEDEVSGFCDFRSAKIFVNDRDGTARQNFTIAHEMGHWELHKELFLREGEKYQFLPRFADPDQNNPLEKEANHFAANLLVPERLLRPVIHAPASTLADIFGVSRVMMDWRIRNVSSRNL